MTEKEIGEIRCRFNPEKTGITRVRGCYVSEKKEIVSEFDQSFVTMSQEYSAVQTILHPLPSHGLSRVQRKTNQFSLLY